MVKMGGTNEDKVMAALVKAEEWMTIADVARETGLTRTTVSKFLWNLYYSGRAENRQFGPSQAFRVKEG